MIPLSLVLHVALPVAVVLCAVEVEGVIVGVMVVGVVIVAVSLLTVTEAAKGVVVELWLREEARLWGLVLDWPASMCII